MFQLSDLQSKKSGGIVQTIAKVIAFGISSLASFQFFAQWVFLHSPEKV
jgi:putative flippase GtrA